jgi:hypothetical protein
VGWIDRRRGGNNSRYYQWSAGRSRERGRRPRCGTWCGRLWQSCTGLGYYVAGRGRRCGPKVRCGPHRQCAKRNHHSQDCQDHQCRAHAYLRYTPRASREVHRSNLAFGAAYADLAQMLRLVRLSWGCALGVVHRLSTACRFWLARDNVRIHCVDTDDSPRDGSSEHPRVGTTGMDAPGELLGV